MSLSLRTFIPCSTSPPETKTRSHSARSARASLADARGEAIFARLHSRVRARTHRGLDHREEPGVVVAGGSHVGDDRALATDAAEGGLEVAAKGEHGAGAAAGEMDREGLLHEAKLVRKAFRCQRPYDPSPQLAEPASSGVSPYPPYSPDPWSSVQLGLGGAASMSGPTFGLNALQAAASARRTIPGPSHDLCRPLKTSPRIRGEGSPPSSARCRGRGR